MGRVADYIEDHPKIEDYFIKPAIHVAYLAILGLVGFWLLGYLKLPSKVSVLADDVSAMKGDIAAIKDGLANAATKDDLANVITTHLTKVASDESVNQLRQDFNDQASLLRMEIRTASNADALRDLETRIAQLSTKINTKADAEALKVVQVEIERQALRNGNRASLIQYATCSRENEVAVDAQSFTFDWTMSNYYPTSRIINATADTVDRFDGVSIETQMIEGGQTCRMIFRPRTPELQAALERGGFRAKVTVVGASVEQPRPIP